MNLTIWVCLGVLAVGLTACGLYGRERLWEKRKLQEVSLGEVLRLRVPADLWVDPDRRQETGDYATFLLARVNSSHLNGTTSYAENMQVTVFAPDMPLERIERSRKRFGFTMLRRWEKDDVVEETKDGRWQWKVTRVMYDKDPVHEPSWQLVLLDREARVMYDWRGFRKQYELETAKKNLRFMAESATVAAERGAFFTARRDWVEAERQGLYAENLVKVERALGFRLEPDVWHVEGPWRYAIDNERPQRFIVARRLGEELRGRPVDFLGPVTRYAIVQNGYLWEDNQGSGGPTLPLELQDGLRREFPEENTNYYYTIQAANLWRPLPDGFLAAMQGKAMEMDRRYQAGKLVVPAEIR